MVSDDEKRPDEELGDEDEEQALEDAEELVEAGLEGHLESETEHLDRDTGGLYSEALEEEEGFGRLGAADEEITPD